MNVQVRTAEERTLSIRRKQWVLHTVTQSSVKLFSYIIWAQRVLCRPIEFVLVQVGFTLHWAVAWQALQFPAFPLKIHLKFLCKNNLRFFNSKENP